MNDDRDRWIYKSRVTAPYNNYQYYTGFHSGELHHAVIPIPGTFGFAVGVDLAFSVI